MIAIINQRRHTELKSKKTAPPPTKGSTNLLNVEGKCSINCGRIPDFPPAHLRIGLTRFSILNIAMLCVFRYSNPSNEM